MMKPGSCAFGIDRNARIPAMINKVTTVIVTRFLSIAARVKSTICQPTN